MNGGNLDSIEQIRLTYRFDQQLKLEQEGLCQGRLVRPQQVCCGTMDKMVRCSRCLAADYCSEVCKEKDRSSHKFICRRRSSELNVAEFPQINLVCRTNYIRQVKEYLSAGLEELGLNLFTRYVDTLNREFPNAPFVEVGSGNGVLARYVQSVLGISIELVDPNPNTFIPAPSDVSQRAVHKNVDALLYKKPELKKNCVLILNWAPPGPSYDLYAIQVMKPCHVLAIYETDVGTELGSAGGDDFRQWLSRGCKGYSVVSLTEKIVSYDLRKGKGEFAEGCVVEDFKQFMASGFRSRFTDDAAFKEAFIRFVDQSRLLNMRRKRFICLWLGRNDLRVKKRPPLPEKLAEEESSFEMASREVRQAKAHFFAQMALFGLARYFSQKELNQLLECQKEPEPEPSDCLCLVS